MDNSFINYLNAYNDYLLEDNIEILDSYLNDFANKCKYTDLLNFNKNSICEKNDLSILQLNIQSLPSKIDNLKQFLSDIKNKSVSPDLILLSETYPTSLNVDSCSIAGYSLEYNNRNNKKGGGGGHFCKK